MPTLWLPPKVWFHGSQSTSTGGTSPSVGKHCRIICWLLHSMRCVLITPLGSLVHPEANRNLAIVSGPTCARAAPNWAGAGRGGALGCRRGGERRIEAERLAAFHLATGQHHRHGGRDGRLDRLAERFSAG